MIKNYFWQCSWLVVFLGLAMTSDAQQPDEKDPAPRPWNWGFLLEDEELSKDVEMVGPQIKEVKEMYDEQNKLLADMIKKHGAVLKDPESDVETVVRIMKEQKERRMAVQRQMRVKMEEILLPHQVERMDQLMFWVRINRSAGYAASITTEPVNRLLRIKPSQSKTILDSAEKLDVEFQKELFQLRQKYRAQLMQELTEKQRKSLKKMMGEKTPFNTLPLKF